jgi:putative tricarboxylic transport membrane protein
LAENAHPTEGLRRKELASAVFLVVFGGTIMALARRIPLGVPTDPLGPRAFPLALGAGMALCGVLLAVATLAFRPQPGRTGLLADAGEEEEVEAGPFSPGRLIGAVVATSGYLAAFERLGYLLATPLYVTAIMLVHGGVRGRGLVTASLATTVLLYATFRYGLRIPIPAGILAGIIR